MHIAKEHLVKKQIAKNGLMTSMLKISDGALKRIIYAYTKEAGVRELERQIAKICRKAVTRLYEEGVYTPDGSRNTEVKKCIRITDKNLFEYLGKESIDQIRLISILRWALSEDWHGQVLVAKLLR